MGRHERLSTTNDRDGGDGRQNYHSRSHYVGVGTDELGEDVWRGEGMQGYDEFLQLPTVFGASSKNELPADP